MDRKISIVESKADQEKFKNWIGLDMINGKTIGEIYWDKFISFKQRIKSPYNDLYWWMKNKSASQFKEYIDDLEIAVNNDKLTKQKEKEGAQLIYSDNTWKVYHIINYEASAKYGKGTKWCITGTERWNDGNSGEKTFLNYHKENGVEFYFYIKSNGEKYALAIYPDKKHYEIYNAEDVKVPYIADAPVIEGLPDVTTRDDKRILVNAIMNDELDEKTLLDCMEIVLSENAGCDSFITTNKEAFASAVEEFIPDGYLEHEAVASGDLTPEEYESITGEPYEEDWGGDFPWFAFGELEELPGVTKKEKCDVRNFEEHKYWILVQNDSGVEIYNADDYVGLYLILDTLAGTRDWSDDEIADFFGDENGSRMDITAVMIANVLINEIQQGRVSKSVLNGIGLSDEYMRSLGESYRVLKESREDFFKNSVVRDASGNLLPVYHCSFSEFDTFAIDDEDGSFEGSDWRGEFGFAWFAEDESYAQNYGDGEEYECYLNITKPLDIGELNDDVEVDDGVEVEDNFYDSGITTVSHEFIRLCKLVKVEPKEMLKWYHKWWETGCLYDITRRAFFKNIIVKLGYDGVIATEGGNKTWGCVRANQIKLIDNENPTEKDSMKEDVKSGKVGYRVDFDENKETDLRKVIEYETIDLGNVDILETILSNFRVDNEELVKEAINSQDEADLEQAIDECIKAVKKVYPKAKYCIWLCDSKEDVWNNYIEPFYHNEESIDEVNFDCYNIECEIPISDLGDEGKLYVFTTLPQAIEEDMSKEQEDFFKDSVIRDANGNLIPMWHGTNVEFEEFDRPINWFSKSKAYAKQYAEWLGGTPVYYEAYLNCKHPFKCGDTSARVFDLSPIKPYKLSRESTAICRKLDIDEDDFRRLVKHTSASNDEEEYRLKLHTIVRLGAFAQIVKNSGYDSIFTIEEGHPCIGVLNPEDIKIVDNLKPTSSKNINEEIIPYRDTGIEPTFTQEDIIKYAKDDPKHLTFGLSEGASIVLSDGTTINVTAFDTHGLFAGCVYSWTADLKELGVDDFGNPNEPDWDGDADADAIDHMYSLGVVTLNDGTSWLEERRKIVFEGRPTERQFEVIRDFIDMIQMKSKSSDELYVFTGTDFQRYRLGDYTSDEIIDKIKKSFITGRLEETYKSDKFELGTAGYILPDGSFVYMDEYHGEDPEYRSAGHVEFSNTHCEEDTCVRIFNQPNEVQYKKLEEVIDRYLDEEEYCKVEIGNDFYEVYSLRENACQDPYWDEQIGNWTGYKLVRIIKNYFNRINEDLSLNESRKAITWGDLDVAKKTDTRNMMSGRGTGHFGTGFYFVSKDGPYGLDSEGNIKKYDYEPSRPIYEIDLDAYNLYRPKDNEAGYRIHDALGSINKYYCPDLNNLLFSNKTSEEMMEDFYSAVSGIISYDEDYEGDDDDFDFDFDDLDDLDDLELDDEAEKEPEPEKGADKYIEVARQWIIDNKLENWINTGYDDLDNWLNKNINKLGRIEYEVEKALQLRDKYVGYVEYAIDVLCKVFNTDRNTLITLCKAFYNMKSEDSISTLLFKEFGYEGVDVTHLDHDAQGLSGLDNFGYGTVIYDLKPGTYRRIKEPRAGKSGHYKAGESLKEFMDKVNYADKGQYPAYATDSPYQLKALLEKGDEPYRIFYDGQNGTYYFQNALGNATHGGMLYQAERNGWIDSAEDIIDWMEDSGYMVFIPTDFQGKLVYHTKLGVDSYYECRVYPFGVMFVRDEGAYENSLFQALGKPEKEIYYNSSEDTVYIDKEGQHKTMDLDVSFEGDPNGAITADFDSLDPEGDKKKAQEKKQARLELMKKCGIVDAENEMVCDDSEIAWKVHVMKHSDLNPAREQKRQAYIKYLKEVGYTGHIDESLKPVDPENEDMDYGAIYTNNAYELKQYIYDCIAHGGMAGLRVVYFPDEDIWAFGDSWDNTHADIIQDMYSKQGINSRGKEPVRLMVYASSENDEEMIDYFNIETNIYQYPSIKICDLGYNFKTTPLYKAMGKPDRVNQFEQQYPYGESLINEKIVKKGNKWQVQSEKGKNLGTYDTKKEAEDRLKQVHYFKHINESNDEITTTVYTYQSPEVLKQLQDGKTYIADSSKGMFSGKEHYHELQRILGLKNSPIFGGIDKDELWDMIISSGLETSNRTQLLELEVPTSEVHKMGYYDWSDYIYYWIDKQEEDSITKEEAENTLRNYSGDIPCQVVIDRIEPEWLVNNKDVTASNPFDKKDIEKDLDDIHNWLMKDPEYAKTYNSKHVNEDITFDSSKYEPIVIGGEEYSSNDYECDIYYAILKDSVHIGNVAIEGNEIKGFEIYPKYRKQGLGREAIKELLKLHPNIWYLNATPRAKKFWQKVGFKVDDYDKDSGLYTMSIEESFKHMNESKYSGQTSLRQMLEYIASMISDKYNPNESYSVHHLDNNHDNNSLENISLMIKRKHDSYHNRLNRSLKDKNYTNFNPKDYEDDIIPVGKMLLDLIQKDGKDDIKEMYNKLQESLKEIEQTGILISSSPYEIKNKILNSKKPLKLVGVTVNDEETWLIGNPYGDTHDDMLAYAEDYGYLSGKYEKKNNVYLNTVPYNKKINVFVDYSEGMEYDYDNTRIVDVTARHNYDNTNSFENTKLFNALGKPREIKKYLYKDHINEDLKEETDGKDIYYRGYDSRYGVFDSGNEYRQLYTWVTDAPEYALEYAEHNEYGKVAKVRVTCSDKEIGGVLDLPEDVDYYDPGDEEFQECILDQGLKGYGFEAGDYDDFCICISKDCVEVIDPDVKVEVEDESLKESVIPLEDCPTDLIIGTVDFTQYVKNKIDSIDLRVFYDTDKDWYLVAPAYNSIHDDIIEDAINAGYYDAKDYEAEFTGYDLTKLSDFASYIHKQGKPFVICTDIENPEDIYPHQYKLNIEGTIVYVLSYYDLRGLDFIDNNLIEVLKEDFINESKQDIEKFRQWAGDELADRFFKLKGRLPDKTKDIYYWMGMEKQFLKLKDRYKGAQERSNISNYEQWAHEQAINGLKLALDNIEQTPTRREVDKLGKEGSEKIYEDEDWLVLKINTYEASVKYGKGTEWCITGNNSNQGRDDFNFHTEDNGATMYFFINKKNKYSKYALEYVDDENWCLFDETDFPHVGYGTPFSNGMDAMGGECWHKGDLRDTFPVIKGLPDINKAYDDFEKYDEESLREDLQDNVLDALDKEFGQEEVYMWSTYILPNGHFLNPDKNIEYFRQNGFNFGPAYEHCDFEDWAVDNGYGRDLSLVYDNCIKMNVTYPYLSMPDKAKPTQEQLNAIRKILDRKDLFEPEGKFYWYDIFPEEKVDSKGENLLAVYTPVGDELFDLDVSDADDIIRAINQAYVRGGFFTESLNEEVDKYYRLELEDPWGGRSGLILGAFEMIPTKETIEEFPEDFEELTDDERRTYYEIDRIISKLSEIKCPAVNSKNIFAFTKEAYNKYKEDIKYLQELVSKIGMKVIINEVTVDDLDIDYKDNDQIAFDAKKYNPREITESKADWEKFRQWCYTLDQNDELYNWFISLQKRLGDLKDIYWWMKNSTPEKLYDYLHEIQSNPSKKQKEKNAKEGAKLLYDANGWKVYEITTYEAAVKYGKNTTWCISGNYDSELGYDYWSDYAHNSRIIFYIKDNEKWAVIIDGNYFTIWDELDNKIAYIPGAPKVDGLPDVSKFQEDTVRAIVQLYKVKPSDIKDIKNALDDSDLSEFFFDYDTREAYEIILKDGSTRFMYWDGPQEYFMDVTDEITEWAEEYM